MIVSYQKPQMDDWKTVKKSLTIYEDQLEFVRDLARRKHRGKLSKAIQAIIEDEMRRESVIGESGKAEYPKPAPKALKKNSEESA